MRGKRIFKSCIMRFPVVIKNTKLAVVLLVSAREVNKRFLDNYFDRLCSFENDLSNTKFFIFSDKKIDENFLANRCNKAGIDNYSYHNLNLPTEYNVHKSNFETKNPWGLSGGSNLLFYQAFDFLKEHPYENFLLMESDSYPVCNDWIKKLTIFCEKNHFVIAGSKYKGLSKFDSDQMLNHINGVALYKNCKELFLILDKSKAYIKQEIQNKLKKSKQQGLNHKWLLDSKNPSNITQWFYKQSKVKIRNNIRINYDIAIYNACKEEYNNNIIDTNIIANYSLIGDADESLDNILKKHPELIILHQKTLPVHSYYER